MTSEPPRELGYRPGLDGLRAVAIGSVLLHHTSELLVPQWKGRVATGGFLGVDLFFVLSGYLITRLLLERRERQERNPIRRFYARRALRLLPAVALLMVANLTVTLIELHDVGRGLRSFLVVFTYTTNWAELHGVSISPYITHLWSLAIEEQFYAVWPVVLLGALGIGLSRRSIGVGAVLLAVASILWRSELLRRGTAWLAIYIRTDARADALLIGAALCVFRLDLRIAQLPRTLRTVLGLLALALFIGAVVAVEGSSRFLCLGGFTLIALICALLLAIELDGSWPVHRVLSSRPAVWLGRLSYSLYLWHFLVFLVVAAHLTDRPSWWRSVVAWTVTLVAAVVSFHWVERPALRVKDRIGGASR